MNIVYNDYFLGKKFLNEKFFKSKYNIFNISEFCKIKNKTKLDLIFEMIFIIPVILIRLICNKEGKTLFFDVESISGIFLSLLKLRTKDNIIWLWNPILDRPYLRIFISIFKFVGFSIITFDRKDAEKYKIKFYTQIINSDVLPTKKKEKSNKLFFIGQDKGRYNLLKRIDLLSCRNNNIFIFSEIDSKYSITKTVEYDQYIEILNESMFVIDLVQKNQSGLTIRVLEALFLNKKIITNNYDIINYNFYSKDRILIIDDDFHEKDLIEFISDDNEDINTVNPDLLCKYELSVFLDKIEKCLIN